MRVLHTPGAERAVAVPGLCHAGLSGAVRGVTVRGVTAAVTPDVLLPGCRSPEGSVEGRPVPSVAWLANSGVRELFRKSNDQATLSVLHACSLAGLCQSVGPRDLLTVL